MQSTIEDLQLALKNYSKVLSEKSHLGDHMITWGITCKDTAAHWEQSSTVALKLSEYQRCAEKPGSFCPDVSALCEVIMLNRDLLQHLNGSYQHSGCPTRSPSSSLPDFNSIRESIRCVHCWSQQVEALVR